MSVKEQLLNLLETSGENYLSGEDAATRLSVSRTAIWKAINLLKKSGYDIEAVTNRGYRISNDCDVLTARGILKNLPADLTFLKLEVKSEVTSTNTLLKEKALLGATEGTVIVAGTQTSGRGRFTRSFFSPDKCGIYMSLLVRPEIPAENAVLITIAAAVAVCEAIEEVSGKKTGIKWVNDVLIDSKKVCGILTEGSINIETGLLDYAVVGIGLNAYTPLGGFPKEISGIAGSIFDFKGYGKRDLLAAKVIEKFFNFYRNINETEFIDPYRQRCIVTGKKITVLNSGKSIPATALEIDDNCRLIVKYDNGSTDVLSSGEISIRL